MCIQMTSLHGSLGWKTPMFPDETDTPAHMIFRKEGPISPVPRSCAKMCPGVWEGMALATEDTQGATRPLQYLPHGHRVQAHTSNSLACGHSLHMAASGPQEDMHER